MYLPILPTDFMCSSVLWLQTANIALCSVHLLAFVVFSVLFELKSQLEASDAEVVVSRAAAVGATEVPRPSIEPTETSDALVPAC